MDQINYNSIPTSDVLPDNPEKDLEFTGCVKYRVLTDKPCLVFLVSCLVILSGYTLYCAMNGDLDLVFNGYDSCGNICGIKNEKLSALNLPCSGEDMTDKKMLQIDDTLLNGICMETCNETGYVVISNRCIPESQMIYAKEYEFLKVLENLMSSIDHMFVSILFTAVCSILVMLLLYVCAAIIIWFLLYATMFIFFIFSISLWSQANLARNNRAAVKIAIVFSCITFVVFCLILAMRKRIKLVVRLFKEAGKALIDMPLLFAVPFLTSAAIVFFTFIFTYFALQIIASSAPDTSYGVVIYKDNKTMKFFICFLVLMWLWTIQFCIGCQHMVVAGSTASWFFTRDKANLRSPIKTAATNLFSFHLGSVAFGSLIIVIISVIRMIFIWVKLAMTTNRIGRVFYRCISCLFAQVDFFINCLTRNAYIEVAMHGKSFCQGGKRVVHLLTSNIASVYVLDSVGGFVLSMLMVFVILLGSSGSSIIVEESNGISPYAELVLMILTYVVASSFFSVYEMVIDTVFLCFCEDCEMNDGQSKPYFMNTGLMKYMKKAKEGAKVLKNGNKEGQSRGNDIEM